MSRPNPLASHPAVSFTVRRPSPLSRQTSDSDSSSSNFRIPAVLNTSSAPSPLAFSVSGSKSHRQRVKPSAREDLDSSDEDGDTEDEIITGFDAMGVQRVNEIKPSGPLVIPALQNRDWRAVARKRKGVSYVPDSARAPTGQDGSVGGLGTRDTINSGPQHAGLLVSKRKRPDDDEVGSLAVDEDGDMEMGKPTEEHQELTEDERALRAILAGDDTDHTTKIDIISPPPMSDTDVYREDVQTRPDTPTLDDYARVPVEQFGAALLRGMGWKEGTAASRTRKGPIEPYLPVSRPSLLGIGAKERAVDEALPSGSSGSKGPRKPPRPEKRYVPIMKKLKDGSVTAPNDSVMTVQSSSPPSRSGSSSRRASRSPRPARRDYRDREREHGKDSERGRDDDRYQDSGRDSDRDRRDRDYYRSKDKDYDKDDSRYSRRSDDRRYGRDKGRDRNGADRYKDEGKSHDGRR